MNRTAGKTSCLGSRRMIKCSTIGTTTSAAPANNIPFWKFILSGAKRHPERSLQLTPRPPAQQIFRQRSIELHARVQRHVVDAALKALAAKRIAELADFLHIVFSKAGCIDIHPLARLRLFEFDHAVEGKID